ncbi:hypothetical protein TWF718_009347 [Orbilia javanica]|uniref:Uncharacterized protein n=1 Tax=Orbilia javanica TaxID=47235 RepID=A0AAN8MM14_9PEZI
MRAQTIILSSLALFVNTVPVFARPAPDPTESTSVPTATAVFDDASGVMHWTGSLDGGPELDLTGTLQEVLPEILASNTDWEPPAEVAELNIFSPNRMQAKRALAATPTTNENPSLVQRYFKDRPTCGLVPGVLAEGWLIEGYGIPWLRAIGIAGVMCGAQANTCAKCYCDYGSKIELCNVRTTKLDIRCDRLSGAAGEIVKDCGEFIAGDNRIRGHWWDTTDYAAVVRGANSGTCS